MANIYQCKIVYRYKKMKKVKRSEINLTALNLILIDFRRWAISGE
jgi:hypothetical protein